jgi:hypothetical protein
MFLARAYKGHGTVPPNRDRGEPSQNGSADERENVVDRPSQNCSRETMRPVRPVSSEKDASDPSQLTKKIREGGE